MQLFVLKNKAKMKKKHFCDDLMLQRIKQNSFNKSTYTIYYPTKFNNIFVISQRHKYFVSGSGTAGNGVLKIYFKKRLEVLSFSIILKISTITTESQKGRP